MKRILLTCAIALCAVAFIGWSCSDGRAQPQEDPRLAAYRQLLLRANDELSQAMAQAQALSVENAQLKAELAKLKPAEAPKKD